MKTLHIYHHLGLGDHIICNGMVRYYTESYDVVYVFCKQHNVKEVKRFFRDTSKIKVISANNKEAELFISRNPQNVYLIIRPQKHLEESFDKIFYKLANLPFKCKWDNFYVERDLKMERIAYTVLGLKEGMEYIFVHDDKEKGFEITKQLPERIRIVRPNPRLSLNLIDYIYIIEHAKEVHCIDSSFFNLIDCMQLRNEGLFFHKYVRMNPDIEWRTPSFKLDWEIIN